jgi:hypothetical protein
VLFLAFSHFIILRGVGNQDLVSVLRPHLDRRGKRGGQANLSVEDQLLVVLEYWREYRTYFHIGSSWGKRSVDKARALGTEVNAIGYDTKMVAVW